MGSTRFFPAKKITYPRCLVFSGGGVNATAHIGAVLRLMTRDQLKNVDKILGVSAGAFTGIGVICSRSPSEMLNFSLQTDFKKFLHPHTMFHGNAYSTFMLALTKMCFHFFKELGVFSTDHIRDFINAQIEKRYGIKHASFADLKKVSGVDFYVGVTNMSKRGLKETFSSEHTPLAKVADAVAASAAVPGLFKPVELKKDPALLKGDFYADGGIFDNFPYEFFDLKKYVLPPGAYDPCQANEVMYNSDVLSFLLATTEEIEFIRDNKEMSSVPPVNPIQYMEDAAKAAILRQKIHLLADKKDPRIIFIDVGDSHPLNFWNDRASMRKLLLSGWNVDENKTEMTPSLRSKL